LQGKRTERFNALIRSELGRIITTRLKDKRLGFVTVTHVEISPDLKYCKVFVSVLGNEQEVKGTIAALEHSEGFLKKELAKTVKMRFTPRLQFKIDNSLEENMRLENIFKKIHDERGAVESQD
jgi:ribosome-binding factor A